MRVVLSLLIGLTVILGQSDSFLRSAGEGVSPCKCCSCGRLDCCDEREATVPVPIPLSLPSSHTDSQFLLLDFRPVVYLQPLVQGSVPGFPAAVCLSSVPLYQRNCIFLI